MTEEQLDPKKLFVGGLPWKIKGLELREIFSEHGDAVYARVVFDRQTRRSKGFGFVTFETEEGAAKARDAMDGAEIEGRTIRVDFAKLKEEGEDNGYREETEEADETTEETTEEAVETEEVEAAEETQEENTEESKED